MHFLATLSDLKGVPFQVSWLLVVLKNLDCNSAGRTAGIFAVFGKEKPINMFRVLIPFHCPQG